METYRKDLESSKLRKTLEQNREHLLKLVEDWHIKKTIEYSRIIFEYDKVFGDLECELNKAESEANEIQKKIDELISSKTKNSFSNNYNRSFNYSSKGDEVPNTSQLYRKIVKKLHPDTCENLELNKKYWDKVQSAYKSKNSRHLEIIHDTICVDYESLETQQMRKEIHKLEKYIAEEKMNLEKLNYQEPYIYETKLKDKLWVIKRRRLLENKLKQAENRLSLKKKIYSNFLKRKEQFPLAS